MGPRIFFSTPWNNQKENLPKSWNTWVIFQFSQARFMYERLESSGHTAAYSPSAHLVVFLSAAKLVRFLLVLLVISNHQIHNEWDGFVGSRFRFSSAPANHRSLVIGILQVLLKSSPKFIRKIARSSTKCEKKVIWIWFNVVQYLLKECLKNPPCFP